MKCKPNPSTAPRPDRGFGQDVARIDRDARTKAAHRHFADIVRIAPQSFEPIIVDA
jgi:hypothetical protein